MEEKKQSLSLAYMRRFGTEIEINAFDGRSRPLIEENLPEGAHYVGSRVHEATGEKVLLHKWGHDHNNDLWIIKPDSSCGMEVCSPVSKGWYGLKKICQVIDALRNEPKVTADNRCSLHVHVDVSDLTADQLAAVLSWWIKCETVFLDSVPASRKRNRYCQFLGLCDMFEHDGTYNLEALVKRLGTSKYGTLNTYHFKAGKRQTIEFRIMENECCLNSYMAKNWIRLLIHFVEMAAKKGMPKAYEEGDPWTGYCWLDPKEVFELLGLDGSYELSLGLQQVKSWFLGRLLKNAPRSGLSGVMSSEGRSVAYSQYKDIVLESQESISIPNDIEEAIYGENFKV